MLKQSEGLIPSLNRSPGGIRRVSPAQLRGQSSLSAQVDASRAAELQALGRFQKMVLQLALTGEPDAARAAFKP